MKKLVVLLFVFSIVLGNSLCGQSFEQDLKSSFAQFEGDTSYTGKLSINNRLVLIANKWEDQWLTHYYAAYGFSVLSFLEKDEAKRDSYLDEADKHFKRINELLKTDDDEVFVLAALMANARLSVKPSSRWKQYGDLFNENIENAKKINSNNPKIYYLQGVNKYHLPKTFGGGAKGALQYFEKSDGLYKTANINDITKPVWGKGLNTAMLSKCKAEAVN